MDLKNLLYTLAALAIIGINGWYIIKSQKEDVETCEVRLEKCLSGCEKLGGT